MNPLWWSQIAAVLRIEMKKTFFSRRGLWVYLLAFFPLVLFAVYSIREFGRPSNFGRDTNVFATVFQVFYLRLAIFFGCVGIFMNLFRGEVLDRSLHFYFLAPIRREVLLAGKFIAGLTAAIVIFTSSIALQFVALYAHYDAETMRDYMLRGNGIGHLIAYVGVTALACVGYGSVFLAAGVLMRNPIVPAALILVWEAVNNFLPSLLQKFSVIFYLKSLCPIQIAPEAGEAFSFLTIAANPIPAYVAVPGLLALAVLVLIFAAARVRRMEIAYVE